MTNEEFKKNHEAFSANLIEKEKNTNTTVNKLLEGVELPLVSETYLNKLGELQKVNYKPKEQDEGPKFGGI